MNEKITLPGLTQLLALQTGDTKKQAEDFVREFFNVISNALAAGESVKIKDLGVFKTIGVEARKSVNVSTGEEHEIPAHKKAVFVPSKELAALVNEPFEMFETVELEDGLVFDDDDAVVSADDRSDSVAVASDIETDDLNAVPVEHHDDEEQQNYEDQDNDIEQQNDDEQLISDEQHDSDDMYNVYTVDAEQEDDVNQDTVSPALEDDSVSTVVDDTVEEKYDAVDEKYDDAGQGSVVPAYHESTDRSMKNDAHSNRKSQFGRGFLSGFVAAAFLGFIACICFFYLDWGKSGVSEKVTKEVVAVKPINEKVEDQHVSLPKEEEVPTAPSDKMIFDTITDTRYLTTMAKDHYCNYHLWPIIYEENKSFLGHPNRIRPGTQVVVPPLSKYGVDPSNPADIAKAKKKGTEIYSRYQ